MKGGFLMIMRRAIKFPIHPTPLQETLIQKTFGCTRFIWNQMLSDEQRFYNETGKHFIPTPANYKKQFPFLKEVDSLALANAQMNLQRAYHNFFKNPQFGFPKFKSKHKNRNSYTTNNQKGSVAVKNGYLKLPKAGLVKLRQHRQIPQDYKIKSVTISQNPSGN